MSSKSTKKPPSSKDNKPATVEWQIQIGQWQVTKTKTPKQTPK